MKLQSLLCSLLSGRQPRPLYFSLPALCLLASGQVACGSGDAPTFAVGGGGGSTTVDQICPNGMTWIAQGSATLGEWDQSTVASYPGTVIIEQDYDLSEYCIGTFPLPGSQGQQWPRDGLSVDQLPDVQALLAIHGRRLCSTAELLYGAAGDNNWRHVDDRATRQDSCDPDDQNPSALGTYAACESPTGLRDFEVRSSWALLDDVTASGVQDFYKTGLPGGGSYAAYGGTSASDTTYAPSNFGIHFHDVGEDAYINNGLRICADPNGVDADIESAWSAQVTDLVVAGSFADWLAAAAADTGG